MASKLYSHIVMGAWSCATQVIEKRKWEEVDWKRHGVFCTFGLFYLVGGGTGSTEQQYGHRHQ